MFTSSFSPSTFSKQTYAARSQPKLFCPESPLDFTGAQTIPNLPHPPCQPSSSTLLLLWLPIIQPLPVISPPPVTCSVCSWESFFSSSVISPRETCNSWTQRFTPKTDSLGKAIPLSQKTNEVRRRHPVLLGKHIPVKLYLYKSFTFYNRLSAEYGISQSTWNLILGTDSQVKATVRAAAPIPVSP